MLRPSCGPSGLVRLFFLAAVWLAAFGPSSSIAFEGVSEQAQAEAQQLADAAEIRSAAVSGYVGMKVIAGVSGANVRDANGGLKFPQTAGVHGAIVGNSVAMTINGVSQVMWPVKWDSAPFNHRSLGAHGAHGYSAASVLDEPPIGSDVSKPDLYSANYSTRNAFFPAAAPSANPPGGKMNSQGNCTWYAYGRALELGFDKPKLDAWLGSIGRHANVWEGRARAAGVTVSTTPVVNSIAATAEGSNWGHVAFVEAVHSDGRITT